MAETMDKENVLYRIEMKSMDSVKWATIQKLNHGKAVDAKVKEAVNKAFAENKKDLELKVGMVGKKGAYKLLLRVKAGSKHIHDSVLAPKYEPVGEMEKGEYKNEQLANQKKANLAIDGVFDLTNAAIVKYDTLKSKFDDIKDNYALLERQLNAGHVEVNLKSKMLSQIKVWVNVLNRYPAEMMDGVFKTHSDEITAFRGGGAGRLCTDNGVDDDHSVDIKKRFMEHTKLFTDFEKKCRAFGPKVHELQNSMNMLITLQEKVQAPQGGTDLAKVEEATITMLEKTATEFAAVVDQTKRNMKHNELEHSLKLEFKKATAMNVDASIKTSINRNEGVQKVTERLDKLFRERLTKIPPTVQNNPEVVKAMIKTKKIIDVFKQEAVEYGELTDRTVNHLKSLAQQLANNT